MFLSSQLTEITQQFGSEIEDLRVLLEEHGLPAGSAQCLRLLASRVNSDHRLHRDLGFLLRSILGREHDQPGTMEVLGVLVVAAAGTRQPVDAPADQAIRHLLRFVMQQRRVEVSPGAGLHSPSAEFVNLRKAEDLPEPAAATGPFGLPSHIGERQEFGDTRAHDSRRSSRPAWVAATVALLVLLAAGTFLARHRPVATHDRASIPAAPVAPAAPVIPPPASSTMTEPAPARVTRQSQTRLGPKPPGRVRRAVPSRREASSLAATEAVIPSPTVPPVTPQPISPAPQPTHPAAAAPAPAGQAPVAHAATEPMPARTRVQPVPLPVRPDPPVRAPADLSAVFAHPEAADAAADANTPNPVFRQRDPVLIARNSVPARPEVQGTVHTGTTGVMASSLMYSPEPEYPAQAIAAGVEGQVTVRAVVGPRGNIIDAEVVSGPPMLREAALDAVARWRYRPYEQDGKPVPIATTAILDFEIPNRK